MSEPLVGQDQWVNLKTVHLEIPSVNFCLGFREMAVLRETTGKLANLGDPKRTAEEFALLVHREFPALAGGVLLSYGADPSKRLVYFAYVHRYLPKLCEGNRPQNWSLLRRCQCCLQPLDLDADPGSLVRNEVVPPEHKTWWQVHNYGLVGSCITEYCEPCAAKLWASESEQQVVKKAWKDEDNWGVPRLAAVVEAVKKDGVAPAAWWPRVFAPTHKVEGGVQHTNMAEVEAALLNGRPQPKVHNFKGNVQEVVERMVVGVDEPECDTPTIVDQPAGAE